MGIEDLRNQSLEGQKGALSRLRRGTKGLAKAMVFATALSLGCDNFSNQPKRMEAKENISDAVQLITDENENSRKHYIKMLLENPDSAISICRVLIPKLRNPELFFEIAARRAPGMAILYAKELKLLSNADEILQNAAENLLDSGKGKALIGSYHCFADYPSAEKILEISARKISDRDLSIILDYAEHFAGKKYMQEVLDKAIKNDPQLAIVHANRLQNYEDAALISGEPGGQFARQYDNSRVIIASLRKSRDLSVKAVNDFSETGYSPETKRKMSLLLQNFLDKKISFPEMAEVVKDDSRMLQNLLDLSFQPNPLGKKAIQQELKYACLKRVTEINRLHEEADSVRFKSIENMNCRELYTLMVFGEEEIFTSTFNGFFNRLTEKLRKENISGNQLLEEVGYNKFRTFIKMASGFNRLNDFLTTMNPEMAEGVLKKFVSDIEKESDMLAQAVSIADTFGLVKDEKILEVMQKEVFAEYRRVQKEKNSNDEALYGLLAGLFSGKINIDDDWLREISEKYKLPKLDKISSSEMFNPDGVNIQQYFFYNDVDGKSSFESFVGQYKNKPDWRIEQKENYLLIKSTDRRSKGKIEIFANLPAKEKEGPIEIEKELQKRNIQSIVVVHRGHSYHVYKTIECIPNIAKIVSLGSCGGYNNLDAVLKKAPGAHIISTKGTGTRHVNDPLFKMLNAEILKGTDIEWSKFWMKAEKELGEQKEFSSYVPPHKNLGVLFIKAYNSIIEKEKKK